MPEETLSETNDRRYDIFLSHNGKEKSTVERIAEKLKREQIEPWFDKWCLTPGGDWQNELAAGLRASKACGFFVGPHGISDWHDLESQVATNMMAKDKSFRVFIVLLPGLPEKFDSSTLPPFLSIRTWVDLRKGIEDPRGFQLLINAIKGVAPGPEIPIEPRTDVCPYRGLQAFDEEHAEFFFGRDREIQRLIEKLKSTRFLAVIGPSGSGKSSLVRAGLIPALRKGILPGSHDWKIGILTPGARPLETLAAHVYRLYPQDAVQKTLDQMASDERTLHLAAYIALSERPSNELIVWVIDQFEEVFTLCRDEENRRRFLLNILYAASIPDGRSIVVLTMRADFYPKCAAYPELAARIAGQQFLVSPMDISSLRQTITEPAWRVGLEFEQGLIETILDDVAKEPGALPLLEYALLELWNRRRGKMMTLEGYQESGGVKGAIAKRADEIFNKFNKEEQDTARRVMLRLTKPGDTTEDTRQRVGFEELGEQARQIIEQLAKARLLVISRNEAVREETVEVAHEALIRNWTRLQGWLNEDREFLLWRQRLKGVLDAGALLSGDSLTEANRWLTERAKDLNPDEQEYIEKSLSQRRKNLAIFSSIAMIVALLISFAGYKQYHEYREGIRKLSDMGYFAWVFNPDNAELNLYQIGKDHQPQKQELTDYLPAGNYFVEAKKGQWTLKYPVYIGGYNIKINNEVKAEIPSALQIPDDMAYIPAGWFRMGDKENRGEANEKPAYDVYLDAFSMDKKEVTNKQYGRFILEGGYRNENFWTDDGWKWKRLLGITQPTRWNDAGYNAPDKPVAGVTWYEAHAYCKWAGKELPTEAEWEKAARGPEGYLYSYGNVFDASKIENPNGYGVLRMTGGVSEWVSDRYGKYEEKDVKNPKGPEQGQKRVRRGGSSQVGENHSRTSFRWDFPPDSQNQLTGFRCVRRMKASD